MKDAYLAVGVENYMLSLKPAPVRWILHMTGAQTDKETGVRQLKLTAEGGRYLRPYARLLLAVAAVVTTISSPRVRCWPILRSSSHVTSCIPMS